MSLQNAHLSDGWVLHRRPWRESSVLLEFLSESCGRVGLVARGARSERSPWRGLLEPFYPLSVRFSLKGDMGTVVDVEAIDDRCVLLGEALWCGLYVNELLMHLLGRDEPVVGLVANYGKLITTLRENQSPSGALRRFEWALLSALGVAPSLETDASDHSPICENGLYRLELDHGFVQTRASQGIVVSGRALLWLLEEHSDPLSPENARAIRQVTRSLIDHQLGGRTLKTREMIRSLR